MMPIIVSCNKDQSDDSIPELEFSVNEREVDTDGIEYSFDILSGGGGYKAEVCPVNEFDKYATATVSGIEIKMIRPEPREWPPFNRTTMELHY